MTQARSTKFYQRKRDRMKQEAMIKKYVHLKQLYAKATNQEEDITYEINEKTKKAIE